MNAQITLNNTFIIMEEIQHTNISHWKLLIVHIQYISIDPVIFIAMSSEWQTCLKKCAFEHPSMNWKERTLLDLVIMGPKTSYLCPCVDMQSDVKTIEKMLHHHVLYSV